MSKASEIVAELERERDYQAARADFSEKRVASARLACQQIAEILVHVGTIVGLEADRFRREDAIPSGEELCAAAEARASELTEQLRAAGEAHADMARTLAVTRAEADRLGDALERAERELADARSETTTSDRERISELEDQIATLTNERDNLSGELKDAAEERDELQDKVDDAEDKVSAIEPMLEDAESRLSMYSELETQLDRSDWSLAGFLEAVAKDPGFVRKYIAPLRSGPTGDPPGAWLQDVASTVFAHERSTEPTEPVAEVPPGTDSVPADLLRYAALCLDDDTSAPSDKTRRIAADAWEATAHQIDRDAFFRREMNRLAEIGTMGLTLPDDAAAAPPERDAIIERVTGIPADQTRVPEEPRRKRVEKAALVPEDFKPEPAQRLYGKSLGLSAQQIDDACAAFILESRKANRMISRPGAAFRGYLGAYAERVRS